MRIRVKRVFVRERIESGILTPNGCELVRIAGEQHMPTAEGHAAERALIFPEQPTERPVHLVELG
jgi:hypothetical protein